MATAEDNIPLRSSELVDVDSTHEEHIFSDSCSLMYV